MPYFLDVNNGLHYLTDEDVANGYTSLLPAGYQAITDDQAKAIQSPALTVQEAQASQLILIDTAYQSAVTQNISYTTEGGITADFEADTDSQTLIMQATQGYSIAGDVPEGFYWVAADNSKVPFTLADLKGLYQAILAQGWASFQKRQDLKSAINEATTVEAVQAIVWA